MEVEFEILASETRQTEQQAEDACSKIFRFSVSMPFPINESMASVECKVHEEQAPKEPYRDIGKRFQGRNAQRESIPTTVLMVCPKYSEKI